jgi:hypothetical protein
MNFEVPLSCNIPCFCLSLSLIYPGIYFSTSFINTDTLLPFLTVRDCLTVLALVSSENSMSVFCMCVLIGTEVIAFVYFRMTQVLKQHT